MFKVSQTVKFANPKTTDESFAQTYGVEYHCESFENRENYSMGGGNYLGSHRYGGWKVYSRESVGPCEFYEAPRPVTGGAKRPRKARPVAKESPIKARRIPGESFAAYARREWLNIHRINEQWYTTSDASWTLAELRAAGWVVVLTGQVESMPDDTCRTYFAVAGDVIAPTTVDLYHANV